MAFSKLNSVSSGSVGTTNQTNIALHIKGFDLNAKSHYAIGQEVNSEGQPEGPEIRVTLRADKDASSRRYKRREIEDISKIDGVIGSVVLFEGAYPDAQAGENVFNARWGTTLTRKPDDIVRQRFVSVRYGVNRDNEIRTVRFDTVSPEKAVCIDSPKSVDEFRDTLSQLLVRAKAGSCPMVSLRFVSAPDENTGDRSMVSHFYARARNEQNDDGEWTICTGERSAQMFLESESGKAVVEVIEEGSMGMIEMIPGHSFTTFSQTRDRLCSDGSLRLLAQTYRDHDKVMGLAEEAKNSSGNGIPRDALLEMLSRDDLNPPVFRNSFLAIRAVDENKIFPIEIPRPVEPNEPGFSLASLVTAHVNPTELAGLIDDPVEDNPAADYEDESIAPPSMAGNLI